MTTPYSAKIEVKEASMITIKKDTSRKYQTRLTRLLQ